MTAFRRPRSVSETGSSCLFGSDGWHEGKFTTWSRIFHAVGIDWNIPDEYITVPQRKIDKLRSVLAETLGKAFLLRKRLDSASSASSDT
ncbi:hypothetical protein PF008_g18830 [Phytophthora fragariae]|uniref:Uncharacterized protein n=1 Tax=Phytophthora fragariae TaxID=53985 RepID=A0A6G0R4B4_9STRA|nr:hypothetical protein PF008_g18830 [Phytophthora fragariae]